MKKAKIGEKSIISPGIIISCILLPGANSGSVIVFISSVKELRIPLPIKDSTISIKIAASIILKSILNILINVNLISSSNLYLSVPTKHSFI